MQTTFEKMGGTYRQVGDYLLPNIEVPKSPQIGIWGGNGACSTFAPTKGRCTPPC